MNASLFTVDRLTARVYPDPETLAEAAAQRAAAILRQAIAQQGQATAIFATGSSQLRFLAALTATADLDWPRITGFHLDEYLGIAADQPASFRRYLRDHLVKRVNFHAFHALEGDARQPLTECDRYTALLKAQPIDLCCLGVGENGHLAFNEPQLADPADPYWVKLVKLDARNRQQQVDQGFFPTLAAVPDYALTLTLPAIAAARHKLCLVMGARKAATVQTMLRGPIGSDCPASLLRQQTGVELYLDREAFG
ncbi:MAG: glucosamine-6-phosphate deaminase [Spirulinaceae cyanobacterium RM2_2_10]|nr:glucosamine-6-phosphate deaminase [Spirulinaceae cyanobacterium SM2_1_0]NJO20929.1 glucosamine-6-phosphate deaminase [Spirulinaceae cyanobacterium RM2_2_10]